MKSTKNIAIIIVVIIVGAMVYFYFEGGAAPASGSLLQGSNSGDAGVGSNELNLLGQIQSLKIDTSLFTEPAYATLQDYSVPIPSENVGRANPFEPFPGAPTSGASTQAPGAPVIR